MLPASYKEHWNRRASSPEDAIAAVDGSTNEEILQHTGRWSARQMRTALGIGRDDHVLELGCGVGRIARELADHCAHWTGVDISDSMIAHASERLRDKPNVTLHLLDSSRLDMIADESIDKAYSIAVFCHMDKEDLYLYLQDLNRVLRPGGLIFVETWNLTHPVGWRRWEYEPLVWSQSDQTQRKNVARNQFCTPQEFELYVEHAGFTPLANFNASQSVQILAAKQPSADQLSAEQQRIEGDREQIAYSELYATLFGQFVDVIFGKLPPEDMLAFIDGLGDVDEARLYRPYFLSVWQAHAEQWGPVPDPDSR